MKNSTEIPPVGGITRMPSTAEAIGPRTEGAIYESGERAFRVLELVTDPARARELLHRDSARWAVVVQDVRFGGEPLAVGSVWTSSDRLLREGVR